VPAVKSQPERISIVMISEAAPAQTSDYFPADTQALFAQATLQAGPSLVIEKSKRQMIAAALHIIAPAGV